MATHKTYWRLSIDLSWSLFCSVLEETKNYLWNSKYAPLRGKKKSNFDNDRKFIAIWQLESCAVL